MEMLVLCIGHVASPVLQLHTQRVGHTPGQLLHYLIAHPVLFSQVTEALHRGRKGDLMPIREAMSLTEELGWARIHGHFSKSTALNGQVHKHTVSGHGDGALTCKRRKTTTFVNVNVH